MSEESSKKILSPYVRRSLFGWDYGLLRQAMPAVALLAIGFHSVFYLIRQFAFGMNDSLAARGVAIAVLLGILLFRRQFELSRFAKVYYELAGAVSAPGIFAYLYLLNNGSFSWSITLIFGGMVYGIFAKPVFALPLYPLSVLAATQVYSIGYELHPGVLSTSLQIHMQALLAVIVTGTAKTFIEAAYYKLLSLKEQSDRHKRALSAILDVAAEIGKSDDLEYILPLVLEKLDQGFPGRGFGLIVEGPRPEIIQYMTFRNLDDEETERITKQHRNVLTDESELSRHNRTWDLLVLDNPEKFAQVMGGKNWTLVGGAIRARAVSGTLPHWLKLFIKGKPFGARSTTILGVFLDQVKSVIRARIQTTELERYANTDSLTGTFNRGYLKKVLGEFIDKATDDRFFSVIYFDINSLKQINDTYGHQAGDDLIKLSCMIVKAAVRDTDLVFRIGGDEFVILCPNTNQEQADLLVERIFERQKNATVDCTHEQTKITVSEPIAFSIGSACSLDTDPEQVIEVADKRMIQNKEAWYAAQDHVRYR